MANTATDQQLDEPALLGELHHFVWLGGCGIPPLHAVCGATDIGHGPVFGEPATCGDCVELYELGGKCARCGVQLPTRPALEAP